MKRCCVVAAVMWTGWLGAAAPSAAAQNAAPQESPELELEFVRKLRAKGYYDLTKEYIDGLRKRLPQLAGQLDIEQARALVAMAREKDLNQRAALFGQATDLFNQYVKKFDGKPEAIQARLELAKLVAYHGQALLTKALREEEPKDQHEAARPAEAKFIEAGRQLEVVIKQLQDQEQIQARFDRGVNYIDQARTYLDLSKDANNTKRSTLINEAKKVFEELSKDESSEVGLLANAWLVKCYQEFQDPQNVLKYHKRVMSATGKSAEPAQRLVRYFYMGWAANDPANAKKSGVEKIKIIQNEGKKWLADHKGNAAALRSWEGQGVRFELAGAYLAEARGAYKDLQSPAAVPLLTQAQKLYSELAELDGDFSEEAARRSISIAATKLAKTRLEDIRDFENSFLKAHVELNALKEAAAQAEEAKNDKERAKLDAAKKQHLREAIRAVYQALSLADSSTPVQKIDDARLLLSTIYYSSADLYRAAVAGEALARTRPPTKRGPQGAGIAFNALDVLTRRDPSDVNRQKLRDLAEYVLAPETQKFWSAEPITSVARYQMAMILEKDDNYKGAIEYLEKIPADFGGFLYAQGQLTFIALSAARDKAQSEEERKLLRQKARAAIERMPPTLPGDADPSTALVYFLAQMELAKFLYDDAARDLKESKLAEASKKYQQMGAFVEQHHQTFTKAKIALEEEKKTQLDTLMSVLRKYSRLGLADVEYRQGHYDKVLGAEFAGPVLKQVQELAKKEGPIRIKDHQVTGDLVGLALRANIQKGDLDGAKQLFEILDRLAAADEGGLQIDSTNVMRGLLLDMELQIRELRRTKNAEKLKETIEKFSKFIDDIAESILKKKAGVREYRFLGSAYGSLEQPKKAADLYGKVTAPKALGNKTLNDEEAQEVKDYWEIRLQLGRAYREAKEFKEALKVLTELLNHPHGQYHIAAEFERNFVYQDNNLWGTAIKGWGQMIPRLAPRAANDTDVKKLYFDAYYYNVFSWYKYSQSEKIKATAKEEPALAAAANLIVRLEKSTSRDGWDLVGQRFEELLEAEPPLKAMYEKHKGAK